MAFARERLPPQITEPILRHAGLGRDGSVDITEVRRNRFSTCIRVVVGPPTVANSYLIKLLDGQRRQAPWCPKTEYEGLKTLWEASQRSDILAVPEPVAYGDDPTHLTTVFVPGQSALALLRRGCRRFAGRSSRVLAIRVSRRIGQWLNEKYRLTIRSAAPYTLEEYVDFCQARADEVNQFCGPPGQRIARTARVWLERLSASPEFAEYFPLRQEHVQQVDCAPQNFLIHPDGRLFGLDLDAYSWDCLWTDPCVFRRSLEYMATNPYYSSSAISACWAALASALDISAELFHLSYFKQVLAHLAWVRHTDRRAFLAESLLTTFRNGAWVRSRLGLETLLLQMSLEEAWREFSLRV